MKTSYNIMIGSLLLVISYYLLNLSKDFLIIGKIGLILFFILYGYEGYLHYKNNIRFISWIFIPIFTLLAFKYRYNSFQILNTPISKIFWLIVLIFITLTIYYNKRYIKYLIKNVFICFFIIFIISTFFVSNPFTYVEKYNPNTRSSIQPPIPTTNQPVYITYTTPENKTPTIIGKMYHEVTTVLSPLKKPEINTTSLENKIHSLINEKRINNGLQPLKTDTKISIIAKTHSEDMATHNYFSHNNLQGENPSDRGNKAGCYCRKDYGTYYTFGLAENIFQNNLYDSYSTINGVITSYDWNSEEEIAKSTVDGWMNSPGHRQNILTSSYDETGIGVAISNDDKVYITQNFC